MTADGVPRLLFVEFLTTERLFQNRSAFFPYAQAFAAAAGAEVRWIVFGHDPAASPGGRFRMSLAPESEARLLAVLRDYRPTRIIWSELLAPALGARVRALLPEVVIPSRGVIDLQYLQSVTELAAALGLPDPPAGGSPFVMDRVTPDYHCALLDDLARSIRPTVPILGGPLCLYRAPARRNPAFADIPPARLAALGPWGENCSFCTSDPSPGWDYRTPVVELALAQVRAARATCPEERYSGDFQVLSAPVFHRLAEFFEGVLALALPPASFYFYARLDEIERRVPTIEALIPSLASAGHTLQLFASGAESLSDRENQRFNKGLTAADIERAMAALRALHEAAPATIRYRDYGELSYITFTPWTTLEDLRAGVRVAERIGLEPSPLFYASRLQMFGDRAIDLLAERDRVYAEEFEDPVFAAYDSGCAKTEEEIERPWRFLHPGVSAIYSLSARMVELPPRFEGDPLRLRVRAFQARLAGAERWPFWIMEELADLAAEGGGTDPSALLAALEERAAAKGLLSPPAQAPPAPATPAEPATPTAQQLAAARGAALAAADDTRRLFKALTTCSGAPLFRVQPRSISGEIDARGRGALEISFAGEAEELVLRVRPRWAPEGAGFDCTAAPPTAAGAGLARRVRRVLGRYLDPWLLEVERAPGGPPPGDVGALAPATFTPWTTLDDLAANLAVAERLEADAPRSFLLARARLYPGQVTTLLAEEDGLLAAEFDDPLQGVPLEGVTRPGPKECPWRFRSPEVAAIYSVCRRLDDLPAPYDDDPLARRVHGLLGELVDGARWSLWLLDELLAFAARHPREVTPERLVAALERRARETGRLKSKLRQLPPAERAAAIAQALEPAAERLRYLLGLLEAHPRRPLAGFEPREVLGSGDLDSGGELLIGLARGEEQVRLRVRPAVSGAPALAQSAHYACWYEEPSTLPVERIEVLARRILKVVERYLDPALLDSAGWE